MRSLHRIVPVSWCVAGVLMLSGCDRSDSASASVNPVVQQAPSAPAKPAPPPPSKPGATTPPKSEPAPPPKPAPAPPAAPSATDQAASETASSADQVAPAAPAKTPPGPELSTSATAPPGLGPQSIKQGVPPVNPTYDPANNVVKADPPEVNFGDIATNDTGTGKVHLVNTGDKPMTVVSMRASCGCTALKFTPNTIIPPKEAIDVDVQMHGSPKPGPIMGKTITAVVDGQAEVVIPLKGQAVSFVVTDPEILDPEKNPEGKFKLKSVDNQAFRIMSTQPPVIEDLPKDAKVEYELVISWAKYRELGITRPFIIYLDHPKCQQVFTTCNFKPEEIAAANAEMQRKAQANSEAIKGAQPNLPPAPPPAEDADTQLANLIKDGHNDEVLKKLATGLDVNYRDHGGLSLLAMAAKVGNTDLMKALMNTKKADINLTDNVGRTPLMHAAGSKNAESVRILLDAGANPSTRDNLGTTALSWAAWLGNAETVRELIDAGSDVEIVGSITGWTPLILASGFGDPAAIEALIKAHANIEAADMLEGATPLIHAARTGKVEHIKALLKRGANLESPDRNGNTPLLAAAKSSGGDAEKVAALLDAGANIHAKDNRGLNALALARKRTDIRAPDVVKILEPLLAAETPAAPAAAAAPTPAPTVTPAAPATVKPAPGANAAAGSKDESSGSGKPHTPN